MPIDEVQFGRLIGLMEGVQQDQKEVLETVKHIQSTFTAHAKEDVDRFEKINTHIAFSRGQLRIWMLMLSTGASLATAGIIEYFRRTR